MTTAYTLEDLVHQLPYWSAEDKKKLKEVMAAEAAGKEEAMTA